MPDVHDPSQGRGRRRRKRKTTDVSARTAGPSIKAVRAVSGSGDLPAASYATVLPFSVPTKTILKKNPKRQPTNVAKDPFSFDEKSPDAKRRANVTSTPSLQQSLVKQKPAAASTTPSAKPTAVAVTEWKANRPPCALGSPEDFARHAVVLDTRYIDTPEGRAEYETFRQGAQIFLQACSSRGTLPSMLVWKGLQPSHSSGGALDGPTTTLRCEKVTDETLESTASKALFGVPALDTQPIEKDKTGVNIPQCLSAAASWEFLSDTGESPG
jgi:hypothetical protein